MFFRASHYDEAIAEFTEAYAHWQNPTILYSLAQSHERMLHVPRAIAFYEQYLATAGADASHRGEVEETLRALGSLLADVEVQTNVPSRVWVDDEEVGRAPGVVRLAIGRHTVELRATGYVTQQHSLTLAARTRRELRAVLLAVPPPPREPTRLAPAWFWTGVSVTGAFAISAVALGGATLAAASAYDANLNRTQADHDSSSRLAVASDVCTGLMAAFGAATTVVGFNTRWRRTSPPRTAWSVLPVPGALVVGGTF